MLQLRDHAHSVLPVSRVDIVRKGIREEGYGDNRVTTYYLWIYLRGRKDEIGALRRTDCQADYDYSRRKSCPAADDC